IGLVGIIVEYGGGDGGSKEGKNSEDGKGSEDQVANAGPPTVKLFVPAKVGHKRRIKASLETKTGEGGDHKAFFEGEVTTLEVTEGQETKVQIKADRLTQKIPGREEIEDVPPG